MMPRARVINPLGSGFPRGSLGTCSRVSHQRMHQEGRDRNRQNAKNRSQLRMAIRIALAAELLMAGGALSRGKAFSATITVDTLVDEPLSHPNNGNRSLREAIQVAISDTSVDTCLESSGVDTVLNPNGSYLLTQGEIVLSSDLILDGDPVATISGGDSQNIFRTLGLISITSQDLVLQNGVSSGAGNCLEQWSSSSVSFSNVALRNCSTTGRGGAITSDSDLIITDSLLYNNSASGDPSGNNSGGAICSTGNLTIKRTRLEANTIDLSASPSQGEAIHFIGTTLVVEDGTFERNEAVAGGAIFGSANISGTTFYLNSASGHGGAIQGSSLTLTNSTLSGNDKGGIYSSGTTVITNSTFYANSGEANITRQTGTTTVTNTMLSASSGDVNCSNSITSAGFNLDNNNTCGFAVSGDLGGTNPQLGMLA